MTPTVDPDTAYTPRTLAAAVGWSERSIRQLYRNGKLRYRRLGPGGGRVEILGAWWQEYLRAVEVAPKIAVTRPAPPVPRGPRAVKPRPAAVDPLEAFRQAMGRG